MCTRDVGLTLFFLRAHAEVRPYRIIVQIVFCSLLILLLILFLILLLVPSFYGRGLLGVFLLLAGGGQEGIVSGIEASKSIPLNSPFPRGRNILETTYSVGVSSLPYGGRCGGGCEGRGEAI